MKIDGVSNMINPNLQIAREGAKTVEKSFGDVLNNAINEVDKAEKDSINMMEKLATGEIDNIHEVFVASQKAELSLNMAIEVKNRVVEAYREIMRLQL